MFGNIENWIETLKKGEYLKESEVKVLCRTVISLLIEENTVRSVSTPITICGDIHGQFFDLLELFRTGGDLPDTRYIFLGDFVDRGFNSVETLQLLLCLKVRWTDQITLLRGNHESRQITQVYGFYEECMRKYGNANPWRYCTDVFDHLNLAALVDREVLCVHGGLSPDIKYVDQIRTIDRVKEIPHEGAFCDLLWSDPEDIKDAWALSPRGAGFIFGSKVADEFRHLNDLSLICRAHQLVMEGFKYHFSGEEVLTVWSAPNYCYRCGNIAAILTLDEKHNRKFALFYDVPENVQKPCGPTIAPYFI